MNKTIKTLSAVLFGSDKKFQTYEPWNGGEIQIRDNRPDAFRKLESHGIVMVFPIMGGQYATYQNKEESRKLARKIVRMLNK